jgi:flagellar biosynthesis protein FlhF
MKMRRFRGGSTREVLGQIRQALGPEAVILSNRTLDDGVEIVAAIDFNEDELAAASATWSEAPPVPPSVAGAPAEPSRPVSISIPTVPQQQIQELRKLLEQRWGGATPRASTTQPGPSVTQVQEWGFVSWAETITAAAQEQGLAAGLQGVLQAQIPALADPLGSGGIFAVFGPTGAGKTTSVAKLAAQQVLRFGPEAVALFTSDTYRIAGVEQLNIYARILGVPVEVIRGPQDLFDALQRQQGRRWIFIDTMGLSPRDERLDEQLLWLDALGPHLQRFLLVPASLAGRSLEQTMRPYQKLSLNAAILSKVDEAPACGAALEWLAQRKLPLAFFSDGQKVPEDIHPLRWEQLLEAMELQLQETAATGNQYQEA